MAEISNYTIEVVRTTIDSVFTPEYVATDEGQAHLNRVGKAVSNESIELRKSTNRQKKAESAFNKVVANLIDSAPDSVKTFQANKDTWVKEYIAKNFGIKE